LRLRRLPLGIGVDDGEEARAVEVDVGIEVTTVEVVEFGREALRDVFVAEVLRMTVPFSLSTRALSLT
jgi:hypothetical protein